ncbi:MAG: hypothetical protein E7240_00065 [Lachnospiraceae bacterium]|nr:hypothetical protein [Lachnospiraceae bacterium]
MKQLLYTIIHLISRAHEWFLTLNDEHALFLSDKQLHFLVIGLIGMALIFLLHPIFTLLAKTDHVLVISWLYVFTVIIVLTFAIEIGERASGTGTMEFADIAFGVVGFMVMFAVFALVRGVFKFIIDIFKRD